jgi:RNA polymerase subunit RPABC4/transcription elongation factor Spt4
VNEPAAACPFCGSTDTEAVGAWGGQLITSQACCRSCHTYFEVVRDVCDQPGDRLVSPADD